MGRIKDIPQIRALVCPYLDRKRKRSYDRYLRSPDHFYLQTLKGIHEGKRCFVIGNGPSLCPEDLDLLCGEYTFAANRIYNIFDRTSWRPTYYLTVDCPMVPGRYEELLKHADELGHMFLRVDGKDRHDERKCLDFPIER